MALSHPGGYKGINDEEFIHIGINDRNYLNQFAKV